jgi:hypothetical protein
MLGLVSIFACDVPVGKPVRRVANDYAAIDHRLHLLESIIINELLT